MNLTNTISTGLKEIWAHKARSALTMFGIILGVSSLVAMSALAASAAQNPHSAQSGAKPTKQMSSGANANGTAQNMGSSHKQKQTGARAEGGSKTGKNITASEKHRLATSGGSTGVSVSGGHLDERI